MTSQVPDDGFLASRRIITHHSQKLLKSKNYKTEKQEQIGIGVDCGGQSSSLMAVPFMCPLVELASMAELSMPVAIVSQDLHARMVRRDLVVRM